MSGVWGHRLEGRVHPVYGFPNHNADGPYIFNLLDLNLAGMHAARATLVDAGNHDIPPWSSRGQQAIGSVVGITLGALQVHVQSYRQSILEGFSFQYVAAARRTPGNAWDCDNDDDTETKLEATRHYMKYNSEIVLYAWSDVPIRGESPPRARPETCCIRHHAVQSSDQP